MHVTNKAFERYYRMIDKSDLKDLYTQGSIQGMGDQPVTNTLKRKEAVDIL